MTINNRKQFIQETLLAAGKLLVEQNPTAATYSNEKGYLAAADLLMHRFIKTKLKNGSSYIQLQDIQQKNGREFQNLVKKIELRG